MSGRLCGKVEVALFPGQILADGSYFVLQKLCVAFAVVTNDHSWNIVRCVAFLNSDMVK
jgi:hypothetical protein